jgi:L,D-peptidoglycan transpeptidase YkuD (ErfK/YbiS/YcfS/YnhG family)
VTRFSLRDLVPAGALEREAFRVNGPGDRVVVLQYRELGGRWAPADRTRASDGRAVVRIRVRRTGDLWAWGVRRGALWAPLIESASPTLEWRIRVPAAGQHAAGRSRVERTIAYEPTAPPAAPGTHVRPETARQVLVAARTEGARGTYRRFAWRARQYRWVRVGSAPATFGYNGVVPGDHRVQGSGTTPAGTYRMPYAFGASNPGTSMRYRRVTECSYWVLDPRARDYNRWRESCDRPPRSGEHLASYVRRGLYRHAVVTDYNYESPNRSGPGSGGAIFLHYDTQPTAGCVGISSMRELTRTVRWLDPAKEPVIVVTG